jgi:hypothetical protein
MKKFLAVIAVLALTMVGSMAMAEVTFDGSVEMRLQAAKNLADWDDAATSDSDTYRKTQTRLRFGVNGKHENVKGRIQIETDWDNWADGTGSANPGFETRPNSTLAYREGWVDFVLPGISPAHIKVGRQFLQLGNGWFFRSGKYGSDAWVVGLPGKNTIAFVDVKAAENTLSNADDTDAYVLLDTFKIDDTKSVGAYIAHVLDRKGAWTNRAFATSGITETTLDNIGLWFNGKLGAVNLAAELDWQMGEIKDPTSTTDLSGYQLVVQATMPIDSLTINATAAMGSGDDPNTSDEVEQFIPFMDVDPHYSFVYEYLTETASGSKSTAFANTTALGLGAMFQLNKMIALGADLWYFMADQKFAAQTSGTPDDEIGNEVDVKLNLKLYDQLTWNTTAGIFMPGKAYENAQGKADDATAIFSTISYKF